MYNPRIPRQSAYLGPSRLSPSIAGLGPTDVCVHRARSLAQIRLEASGQMQWVAGKDHAVWTRQIWVWFQALTFTAWEARSPVWTSISPAVRRESASRDTQKNFQVNYDLCGKREILTHSEENRIEYLPDFGGIEENFWNKLKIKTEGTIHIFDHLKIKTSYSMKGTLVQRQAINWKKLFAIHLTHKGSVSKV